MLGSPISHPVIEDPIAYVGLPYPDDMGKVPENVKRAVMEQWVKQPSPLEPVRSRFTFTDDDSIQDIAQRALGHEAAAEFLEYLRIVKHTQE